MEVSNTRTSKYELISQSLLKLGILWSLVVCGGEVSKLPKKVSLISPLLWCGPCSEMSFQRLKSFSCSAAFQLADYFVSLLILVSF